VVEELASRSCQLASKFFSHKTTSIHRVDAHIGSFSVTTCLLYKSPSSTLGTHFMAEIAILWLHKILFVRFHLPLIKNCQPYPADLHRHATVGHYCYTLPSCPLVISLWPFIIPSSLNPMADLIHLTHLFICVPLVHHVARLRVAPSRWLHQVNHSIGEITLACP
jgi:hypothetical protein